jgi:hypothetical protein
MIARAIQFQRSLLHNITVGDWLFVIRYLLLLLEGTGNREGNRERAIGIKLAIDTLGEEEFPD